MIRQPLAQSADEARPTHVLDLLYDEWVASRALPLDDFGHWPRRESVAYSNLLDAILDLSEIDVPDRRAFHCYGFPLAVIRTPRNTYAVSGARGAEWTPDDPYLGLDYDLFVIPNEEPHR